MPAARAQAGPDELLYEEAWQAIDSGELARAHAMLETLLGRQPRHAGAWLDLALLNCQRGDFAAARRILERVEAEFSPAGPLRELIGRQVALSCRQTPRLGWRLAGLTGYDDNVNLGARNDRVSLATEAGAVDVLLAEAMRPRGSAFFESWLEGVGQWQGLEWQAALLTRRHADASDFDLGVFSLSASGRWQGAHGSGRGLAQWSRKRFGGLDFLDAFSLRVQWEGAGLGHDLRPAIEVGLARHAFPSHPEFDAWVAESQLGVAQETGNGAWRAMLIANLDLARGARPGGRRQGLGGELAGEWRVRPGTRVSASIRAQHWLDAKPYFGSFISLRREQSLWQARLGIDVDLGQGVQWQLGWSGRHSSNNLPFLDHSGQGVHSGFVLSF